MPDVDAATKKMILSSVLIPVFDSLAKITIDECTLPITQNNDGTYTNSSYKYTDAVGGFVTASGSCSNIYNTLCPIIRRDRAARGDGQFDQLYSMNPDTPLASNPTIVNPFVDCNCENSWYRVQKNVPQTEQQADAETLAQNLDTRCSGSANRTFKTTNKSGKTLCFNSVTVGGRMSAEEQSMIKINQSCSAKSTNIFSESGAPTESPSPIEKEDSTWEGDSIDPNAPIEVRYTGPPMRPTTTPPTSSSTTSPPTTSAPTQAPLTYPPTQAPLTYPPTAAPTVAPTTAPTATPTESPNSNYIKIGLGILGIVFAVIIIALIIRALTKKSKGNRRSSSKRGRRNDDEDDYE